MLVALLAASGAVVVAARVTRPVAPPRLSLHVAASAVLAAGSPPAVPLPSQGSLQLDSDRDGSLAALDASRVRPIGSVAKTMTALQVLTDRPLAAGEAGPEYVISAGDVALLREDIAVGGSFAVVAEGEHFSERQLLLGLMLPSANNLAETLALWDAGSRDAFLARLNARAAALGMHSTHFDDPSGLSPHTVSSAADLVLLGKAALQVPALAEIVATQQATLPDGTPIHNLDADLGTVPGWLGIKTGETPAAGGCLLFAARRSFDSGATTTVVGAVLGQPVLAVALQAAAAAAQAGLDGDVEVQPGLADPQLGGAVSTDWGASSGVVAQPQGAAPPLVVRRGASISFALTQNADPQAPAPAGTAVGHIDGLVGGTVRARWTVLTTAAIDSPTWQWRLQH